MQETDEQYAVVYEVDPVLLHNKTPTELAIGQLLDMADSMATDMERLHRRMDVQELELNFYKSMEARLADTTYTAQRYAERAVADAFGLMQGYDEEFRHLAFHRHATPRTPGYTKKNKQPEVVNYHQATMVLCSILNVFFGMSAYQIRDCYRIQVTLQPEWCRIYQIIHTARGRLSERDAAVYDTYAARYRHAYRHMRESMQADGYWNPVYEDPNL